jgi:hypothetical protein
VYGIRRDGDRPHQPFIVVVLFRGSDRLGKGCNLPVGRIAAVTAQNQGILADRREVHVFVRQAAAHHSHVRADGNYRQITPVENIEIRLVVRPILLIQPGFIRIQAVPCPAVRNPGPRRIGNVIVANWVCMLFPISTFAVSYFAWEMGVLFHPISLFLPQSSALSKILFRLFRAISTIMVHRESREIRETEMQAIKADTRSMAVWTFRV